MNVLFSSNLSLFMSFLSQKRASIYLSRSLNFFQKLLQAINAENQDARASSSEGKEDKKVGFSNCTVLIRFYRLLSNLNQR